MGLQMVQFEYTSAQNFFSLFSHLILMPVNCHNACKQFNIAATLSSSTVYGDSRSDLLRQHGAGTGPNVNPFSKIVYNPSTNYRIIMSIEPRENEYCRDVKP